MVTLCWETHSSSYGSFLLIHKVLLTQNYCHERTGEKQQIFRASSQTPSLTLDSEASSSVGSVVGSAALLCTLRDYLLVFTSRFLPISGLWRCFISLAAYLVHPSLFSVTYRHRQEVFELWSTDTFQAKISILRRIRAIDCTFQINQFYKHKSIIYILFPVFFLSF